MDQLDASRVAAAILAAPPTTLLALTTRHPGLRAKAAERLAKAILGQPTEQHPDQLALPMG